MAMTSGKSGTVTSGEINATPLIDVLLVLPIIFMVIVPVAPKGLRALVPLPPKNDAAPSPSAIVVSVLHAGSQVAYKINQDGVSKGDLPARLAEIYQNRAQRTIFVKGDNDVSFAQIADVINISHSAGVDNVGLITPKISAGL